MLSPRTPSATWLPTTPLVHVFVPMLRNCSVTVPCAAGCIAGSVVCDAHAECRPLSGGTLDVPPPELTVDPVLKSHSFVTYVPATVMSKRTWYVVFTASGCCGMITW